MEVRFNITKPLQPVSRDSKDFVSNPGETVVPRFELRIGDKGEQILVEVGKRNLAAEVNAWKESTDISILMTRFRNGDLTALDQRKGEFIDVTEFPKTNRDVLNQVIEGRKLFDSLPVEVKKNFDGSFEKWFSTYGDKEWFAAMGVASDFLDNSVKPVQPVEEVKE